MTLPLNTVIPVSYIFVKIFPRFQRFLAVSEQILHHPVDHREDFFPHIGRFRVGILQRSSLYAVIEFDFRFCTGRSYAQPCVVCQIVIKDVGIRKTCSGHFSRLHIFDLVGLVVPCFQHFISCDLCRRIFTQRLQNLLDLCKSLDSL